MRALRPIVRVADGIALRRAAGGRPLQQRLARVMSAVAGGGLLWHATSVLLAIRPGRSRRVAIGGSASWLATSVFVAALKRLVRRPRPALGGAGPPVRTSSMPSSHAAASFAYAAGASMQHPAAAVTVLPAALVAWSRLGTRRHFPTDVAIGIVFGAGLGTVVGLIVRRLTEHVATDASEVGISPSAAG
jgi:membrane-associated phospholipid phosphatase